MFQKSQSWHWLVTCTNQFIILLILFLLPATGFSAERIGLVKTLQPDAKVLRQGDETNLQIGSEIFEGDNIITDNTGSVGITFNDGSVLTVGSSGEIIIDTYLFNLAESKFSFLTQVFKGTVAFISGAINKLAPGSMRFKTPTAMLGMRGTKVIVEVD